MNRTVTALLFLALTSPVWIHSASALGSALDEGTAHAWVLFVESALKCAVVAAFALFFFLRPPSLKRSRAPIAWAACAIAILSAGMLGPPTDQAEVWAILVGEGIVIVGVVFTFASVSFLGKCFGVLPEVRGLVTNGPYRVIRHPVYLGEMIAFVGFVVGSQQWLNILPLLTFAAAQGVRMRLEEAALLEAFPDEYGAYAARTPRLIPGLRPAARPAPAARTAAEVVATAEA